MTNIKDEIRKKWPPRRRDAHKGDFGSVLVVAGSKGMSGAALLCGMSALRAGAGLVTLAVPDAIYEVTAKRYPDLMVRPFESTRAGTLSYKSLALILKLSELQDVVALGPGLSRNAETEKWIRAFVKKCGRPMILDADGLNAFESRAKELRSHRKDLIITPHPGEFVRVFGGKLSSKDSDRISRASDAAKLIQATVLLKGMHTVIAQPGKWVLNRTGNPGMAKGGLGDVLTGILAALMAQKFSLWDSSRFAAFLHGLAADESVKETGEVSLTASDVLERLPQVIKNIRKI